MEDHIIAAHAALIIGYLLINDRYFNQDQRRFKVESIRDKIKDRSFQVMAQIIRKFVVFMNIMVKIRLIYILYTLIKSLILICTQIYRKLAVFQLMNISRLF
jgi:hypothetical protein